MRRSGFWFVNGVFESSPCQEAMHDLSLKRRPSSQPKMRADPRPRRSGSTPAEELVMRTIRLLTTVACLAPWALPASANDEVQKLIQDPKQWAMQTGDYATALQQARPDQRRQRRKLQVAWTFSTGVLRGHEGSPLVIGDTMYVHTPFPNIVYALDLERRRQDHLEVRAEAGSDRHSGDVLRHRQPRPRLRATARSSCSRPTPRSSRSTPRPARSSGRSRTAIRRRARPTPRPCCR